jgi:hypothetical protein
MELKIARYNLDKQRLDALIASKKYYNNQGGQGGEEEKINYTEKSKIERHYASEKQIKKYNDTIRQTGNLTKLNIT